MAEYICREELIKHLDKCRNDPLFDPDMARICFAIGIFIKNMEAANVQPVKRGKWIIADDVEHFIAVCSECGRTEDSRDIKDMPYCHCGARMDGDNSEN